jgi:hypothetical protein
MRTFESRLNAVPPVDAPELEAAATERVSAWEMIEAGRYQPRRIRGSFPGRDLG